MVLLRAGIVRGAEAGSLEMSVILVSLPRSIDDEDGIVVVDDEDENEEPAVERVAADGRAYIAGAPGAAFKVIIVTLNARVSAARCVAKREATWRRPFSRAPAALKARGARRTARRSASGTTARDRGSCG